MVELSGYLVKGPMDDLEACYFVNQTGGNYFQSTSALTSSLPLFALQLSAVLFTTRLLLLILRPLRQPSIVALITAGVLLGPSVLGATPFFLDHVLPFKAVKVLRFLPGRVAAQSAPEHGSSSHDGSVSSMTIQEREKRLDDEYTYEFMFKTLDDESVTYTEKVVNNGDETLAEIRRNEADFDLYIVGRGEKTRSVLTSGLSDWNSCKELGTMGDALASSNFASHASVLVIQQYVPKNYIATPFGFSASYGSKTWQPLMFSEQVPFGNTTSISHRYVYDQDEDDDDDYDYD